MLTKDFLCQQTIYFNAYLITALLGGKKIELLETFYSQYVENLPWHMPTKWKFRAVLWHCIIKTCRSSKLWKGPIHFFEKWGQLNPTYSFGRPSLSLIGNFMWLMNICPVRQELALRWTEFWANWEFKFWHSSFWNSLRLKIWSVTAGGETIL